MRHLIIYAHPNGESLNGKFKDALQGYLLQKGNEVIVRDLYELQFDPVLSLQDMEGQRKGQVEDDVRLEQEFISWAEHITFIHPIWWTGMPAVMKGYIDRVFSYGFAYRYDQGVQKGLLKGKQAVIINTHGKSHDEYREIGMDRALRLTSDKGIYNYCGFEISQHFFFEKADRVDAETVESWITEILALYKNTAVAL
ncbi:Glutathione-regulated potassium-efflux system ancillary protein KefF [Flavobacterium anhuiense]|jgi:NAD(P)H dehydrogenase (quinone)|uniref:Glutathione-regulated potassium-efflux system ancillary protein KefF n=1 Tax=Flavobacterium anhuiense TaxID=459526 RepID=A0AAC9GJK9_9FLAO|nr:NAD(P)H-dependent oxidoreductase [Flavobacterium anhuiense]AOC96533.1 Glutathione-regulated potassium-efflux system ancillary protein KefF [Flavobacterium anhuiense]SCY77056.1 NAD(P)H dehydrogenase (quinone) [Flavobacterium anhuiense]